MAKTIKSQIFWPIPLYFEPIFQLAWMLRFVSNFVGRSPVVIEWDKIVAEIVNTNFVFFGHPMPPRISPTPHVKLNPTF